MYSLLRITKNMVLVARVSYLLKRVASMPPKRSRDETSGTMQDAIRKVL
jgi:hypothetical protein